MKFFEMTRRQLLKALGGGFLVAVLPSWAVTRLQRRMRVMPQNIDAWIHVGGDGRVTVLTGKVEVGQNARTSVTQAAAEELRVDPANVAVVMGDTDLVPFDMGTFGSMTTPRMIPQIRRAAATVREALLDMAAKRLGVARSSLVAENGTISPGGSGGSVTYGELAVDAELTRSIPATIALTPVDDWRVLGTPVPKVGARDMVTGAHKYASDMSADGMLYAKVLRAPSIGAKLASADTSKAAAMPGVRVVRDGDFVAVAAPKYRTAKAAIESVDAKWNEDSKVSTSDLYALFGVDKPAEGTSAYTCAYIAHAPLEPRAALAAWDGDRMTVHTGTQRPFGVKPEVAQALGLPEDKVRVLMPDTGGGYGGKHSGDAAVEAARVSKALGVPVKVVWTRSEEFRFAYCRPGGIAHVRATVDQDNRLTEWSYDNYNSGGAALETPYDVANKSENFHRIESPIRQGSYRGLAATFNNFARESEMNRLANSAGMDPVEFRLKNLKDERLTAVLKTCAERFGWGGSDAAKNHGFGIACGTEKGSYIATAVEIAVEDETKVLRAVTVFECGKVLNPDLLRLQVEGALIQGLGGALFEAVEYEGGRCTTDLFSLYRLPRWSDLPKIESVLLDRPDIEPAGAGETPIIGIAPAINGALMQAIGRQTNAMPMRLGKTQ